MRSARRWAKDVVAGCVDEVLKGSMNGAYWNNPNYAHRVMHYCSTVRMLYEELELVVSRQSSC